MFCSESIAPLLPALRVSTATEVATDQDASEALVLEDVVWKSCSDHSLDMFLGILAVILGLLGLIGNFISIHVIRIWFVQTESQPTAARQSFALLFLLASADFLFCLSTVPLTAWGLLNERELPLALHENIDWLCNVLGILSEMSLRVTVYVVTLLSLLRYAALYFPFQFKERFTGRNSPCLCVWAIIVVAGLHAIIPAIAGKGYFYTPDVTTCHVVAEVTFPAIAGNPVARGFYFLYMYVLNLSVAALITLMTCCCVIYKLLMRRTSRRSKSTHSSIKYRVTPEESLGKMTVVVTVAFLACFSLTLLTSVLRMAEEFGWVQSEDRTLISYLSIIATVLLCFNTVANPIIYIHYTRHQRAQRKQDEARSAERAARSSRPGSLFKNVSFEGGLKT